MAQVATNDTPDRATVLLATAATPVTTLVIRSVQHGDRNGTSRHAACLRSSGQQRFPSSSIYPHQHLMTAQPNIPIRNTKMNKGNILLTKENS